jgi:hypothetical protein
VSFDLKPSAARVSRRVLFFCKGPGVQTGFLGFSIGSHKFDNSVDCEWL